MSPTTRDPFDGDPLTDHDILRSLWGMAIDAKAERKAIKDQVTATNGRVTALERFRWLVTGGLVVLGALVVPIFLDIVFRGT